MARTSAGTARKGHEFQTRPLGRTISSGPVRSPLKAPQISENEPVSTALPSVTIDTGVHSGKKISFVITLIIVSSLLTFIAYLSLSVGQSLLSIQESKIKDKIEDEQQRILVKKEAIAKNAASLLDKAKDMGMVNANSFYTLTLKNHKIAKQSNTIEDAAKAEKDHTN